MKEKNQIKHDVNRMQRYDTKEQVDVLEYVRMMQEKHPDVEIYVGTDSAFVGGAAHYITVLAFRFDKQGVHGLYKRRVERLKSLGKLGTTKKGRRAMRKLDRKAKNNNEAIRERLVRETVLSVELAYHLKNAGVKVQAIDMDYNSRGHKEKTTNSDGEEVEVMVYHHKSGKVINQCQGMCYEFNTTLKPESQVATPFADKFFS